MGHVHTLRHRVITKVLKRKEYRRLTWWTRETKSDINQIKQSELTLSLENWAWEDCQLRNTAKRAQQLNLHGEKRESEGKKKREGKEKEKRKRKRKGEREVKKGEKRKNRKNRKAKINRCERNLYIYIFRNSYRQ